MRLRHVAIAVFIFLSIGQIVAQSASQSNDEKALPTISEKTKLMRKMPGYFPLYWDDRTGKMWLEIDKWDTEFLFLESLSAGVGQNDIGLDRGQLGDGRVVKFQRVGPKVLLTQVNYGFRAQTEDVAERKAVEDAFAQSVIWGFEAVAAEGDRVLVDATSFYLHDAHHVGPRL